MLKHRLVAGIVLTVFVSGCAAGRAFRKGDEAARAGDWDTAVKEYSRAVQENPKRAEYKIALERATQSASREHITRAHELEANDQLDAALIEYRRAQELDPSNRLAAARAIELEKTIRDRIEKTRPKPAIATLLDQARRASTPLLSPTAPLPVVSFGPNASAGSPFETRPSSKYQGSVPISPLELGVQVSVLTPATPRQARAE